jgi:hypothetical protein
MMATLKQAFVGACVLLMSASLPAVAQEAERPDESVFVMGGAFAGVHFSDAFAVFNDHYESNRFLGVGYQRIFYEYNSFQLGAEVGLGLRLGQPSSAELWGGAVAKLSTFEVGPLNITPSITFGLSAVTDTIGIETERAERLGRAVPVLYYLSPEIAVSSDAAPEWEAFTRLQHRSGGFGTIAKIDGSNAVVLGLRYKF